MSNGDRRREWFFLRVGRHFVIRLARTRRASSPQILSTWLFLSQPSTWLSRLGLQERYHPQLRSSYHDRCQCRSARRRGTVGEARDPNVLARSEGRTAPRPTSYVPKRHCPPARGPSSWCLVRWRWRSCTGQNTGDYHSRVML
jgi:hypothetical protein